MKTKLSLSLLLYGGWLFSQQVADTVYQYAIPQPRYENGQGSIVQVDAAHHNFHTIGDRYAPFARLLRQDGYQVISNEEMISPAVLKRGKIFVISNALDSTESWELPAHSAFSVLEINTLNTWVKNGGSLFLIADHMPFAGAAADLARSFGFEFMNCYALDNRRRSAARFYKGNQTLADHEITRGIDTVVTFTGSAFHIPKGATGLLALQHFTLLFPKIAAHFEEDTPMMESTGYYQGACMPYGNGRIVVMGEAAMFSAQLADADRKPVGMNHPAASQNAPFLLRIMHWLDDR